MEISSVGNVSIEFNTQMKTAEVEDLAWLNSSIIDSYIQPFDDWHLDMSNFDMKTLNFTWKAVSYANNTLDLKLDFNDPLAISPNFQFD